MSQSSNACRFQMNTNQSFNDLILSINMLCLMSSFIFVILLQITWNKDEIKVLNKQYNAIFIDMAYRGAISF